MTRTVRWVCPTEGASHTSVLAPSRPRLDDVRRFCLECSKASGKLVRRVPPTLEREREKRGDRATFVATTTQPNPNREPFFATWTHKKDTSQ